MDWKRPSLGIGIKVHISGLAIQSAEDEDIKPYSAHSTELLEGECCDQYITELYSLAERCLYRTMIVEMICDSLVVRIRDKALSEKLQFHPERTLKEEKMIVRPSYWGQVRVRMHQEQTHMIHARNRK